MGVDERAATTTDTRRCRTTATFRDKEFARLCRVRHLQQRTLAGEAVMLTSFVRCAVVAGLLTLVGCARVEPRAAVGQDAARTSFAFADGSDFRVATARGDVVVLAFFTTWCPTSPATLRAVDRLRASNADTGVTVVAVDEGDTSTEVARLTDRLGVRVPIVFDKGGAAAKELGLVTVPSVVVIDRHGTVRHVHAGYHGDKDRSSIEGEIAALLDTEDTLDTHDAQTASRD
jgi:cytochrome c biogenesis protein CcmG/thiol:disulfide interchange protein DsbE